MIWLRAAHMEESYGPKPRRWIRQWMDGCAKDGLSFLKWLILVKVVELHESGYMYSYYDWYWYRPTPERPSGFLLAKVESSS